MPVTDSPAHRYALSPAEAAHALGICRATIYNLIRRGDLKVSKIGRSTRIPVSEIERLIADGTEAA
jgi:excisionase family DNA binding protein